MKALRGHPAAGYSLQNHPRHWVTTVLREERSYNNVDEKKKEAFLTVKENATFAMEGHRHGS